MGHKRVSGSIRKLPSGRYQARYLAADGLRYPAPTTFARKADADAWLAGMVTAAANGSWRPPVEDRVTLAEYARAWVSTRPLRPRTVEIYEHLLERWILPSTGRHHLGVMPLNRISSVLVREWFADLCRATAPAGGTQPVLSDAAAARLWAHQHGVDVAATGRLPREVVDGWRHAGRPQPAHDDSANRVPAASRSGRATAARAYRLLHAIMNTAAADDLIDANPCRLTGVEPPRPQERPIASPVEVLRLADEVPQHYRAAVVLAAWSGLRGGELFALRVSDVLHHAQGRPHAVRVERTLVELKGQPIGLGPPKTHAGRRTVHLPAMAAGELAEHLTWLSSTDAASDPDRLLFTTESGQPVGKSTRSTLLARHRDAAGLPAGFRWHDLRHTGATYAARSGATLADLMRRLGHSSPRAAMIYQHSTDESDAQLARRMDELHRRATPTAPGVGVAKPSASRA